MADENRHVAFICSKGDLDMAYPALIMGWAALGNGIDVTIFFTFWGMDMITKSRHWRLEAGPGGQHQLEDEDDGVAHRQHRHPEHREHHPRHDQVHHVVHEEEDRGVGAPPVSEYLQMLVDGGAKLYACKMSVDMMGLKKEDFVDGVIDIVTASDFMDMTEGAEIIFI